jgi:hypothetical protein
MLRILTLAVLIQVPGVTVKNDGGVVLNGATSLNLGTGLSAMRTGPGQVTITGTATFDAGPPVITYILYDGGPLPKVAEAYMADASITAQVATYALDAGHAATAAAFDHTPVACAANNFATGIAANGDLTCSVPDGGGGGGSANPSDILTRVSIGF